MIPRTIMYKAVIAGTIAYAGDRKTVQRKVNEARKRGHDAFIGLGSPVEAEIGKRWSFPKTIEEVRNAKAWLKTHPVTIPDRFDNPPL